MKLDSDAINQTLSFETYAGVKYSNLKFISLLDPDTAGVYIDAVALHLQNRPYLPDPVPTAYSDYLYGLFKDAEGSKICLGVPWVREASIVTNDQPNYRIDLTAPTKAQVDSFKSMLAASGIENFKISIV